MKKPDHSPHRITLPKKCPNDTAATARSAS